MADEGTVATKVEARVSLRPLYWQWWQRSPGRPLSRTRLHTSNLRWHTQKEKPELRMHRYTVSPWFVKTQSYSESTQAQRASRFKRGDERKKRRATGKRKARHSWTSACFCICLHKPFLASLRDEQKTLWRKINRAAALQNRSDLAVIDKQALSQKGLVTIAGLCAAAATATLALSLCLLIKRIVSN